MKKIFLFIILSFNLLYASAQDNTAVYNKYFPLPDKNIPFPILTKESKSYYTGYNDVIKYIHSLAEKNAEIITIGSIGSSQKGRDVPSVTFNKKSKIADADKIRMALIGCMHGNEPISTDGMLYVMHELMENPSYADLLDNIILCIYPIVNPDGHEADTRATNNGTDLNRDLAILEAPESFNLKNAINSFDPHIVIDFHEYAPDRKNFREIDKCLTSSYDALFLHTGNLNVDPAIRKVIENDFVNPTKKILEENHRKIDEYSVASEKNNEVVLTIGGTASRSSATNYALQNRISLLMEIRGLSEKGNVCKRRIETDFLAAISYIKIAGQKAADLKAVIADANKRAIRADRDIVVTSKSKAEIYPFTFVDKCANAYKTVDFNASNNNVQTPEITRSRPEAYLILSVDEKVKRVLVASGIEFSEIKNQTILSLEAYQLNAGSYQLVNQETTIGKGAIVINMHQKMGNTIADLLEPEGNNSLIGNDLLKLLNGSDHNLYRITKNQMIQLQNKN